MADEDNGNSNNNNTSQEENAAHDPSRRRFVKNTGMVIGGVAGGSLLGGFFGNSFVSDESEATSNNSKDKQDFDESRQFFRKKEDFEILSDATERIFPEEETGPGAIELRVPYFIDRQLAGAWGINANEYMSGPFYEGEPNQGYQTHLKRQDLFMAGIHAIKEYSEKEYNENFIDLEEEQQNEILQLLEDDEIDIPGAKSSLFFDELCTATIEGAYSDPLYGGNKNMEGWKMKEYPGVQMSYTDKIESDEFKKIKPKALRSYQDQ